MWRKSSYSSTNGGACVEVGEGVAVPVRDSKNPQGPALVFDRPAFAVFVAAAKANEI